MGPPTTITEQMAGRAHERDPLHRLSSRDSDTHYEKCFYCKSKYQAHTCKTTDEVEPGCFPSPGCLRAGAGTREKTQSSPAPQKPPAVPPRGDGRGAAALTELQEPRQAQVSAPSPGGRREGPQLFPKLWLLFLWL